MHDGNLPQVRGEMGVLSPPLEAVDLWNQDYDRAVVNLVSHEVQAAMLAAAHKSPEYFTLDEKTLYKRLKEEGYQPTPTDNRLRLSFWLEYDRAQASGKGMVISNILAGICTRDYFYGPYLSKSYKVAWILCPPTDYVTKISEALDFGLDQLREVLDLPILDEKGRINVKLGELKAKIVAMLDARKHGAVVQRVEQKNMNLNIATSDNQVAKMALSGTMEDLQKRMKELERRERQILNLPTSKEKDAHDDAEILPEGPDSIPEGD